MRNIVRGTMLCATIMVSFPALSVPAWYEGKLTRVWSLDSLFVVMMDSTALQDCKHAYAYFYRSDFGDKHYGELYSLMLAAYATGDKVGMVIDKQGDGLECRIMSADIRR